MCVGVWIGNVREYFFIVASVRNASKNALSQSRRTREIERCATFR